MWCTSVTSYSKPSTLLARPVFNLRFWDGGERLEGNGPSARKLGGNGGEGKCVFNEGNELETLITVLVSPTAPQAKIFSYNETVLQWKTPFLSKKSLKISLTDTWCWGGTGLRLNFLGEHLFGSKIWGWTWNAYNLLSLSFLTAPQANILRVILHKLHLYFLSHKI